MEKVRVEFTEQTLEAVQEANEKGERSPYAGRDLPQNYEERQRGYEMHRQEVAQELREAMIQGGVPEGNVSEEGVKINYNKPMSWWKVEQWLEAGLREGRMERIFTVWA